MANNVVLLGISFLIIILGAELFTNGVEWLGVRLKLSEGTVGSVLAGSIFGDHCSPISDTTILSSVASDCDHLSHVATQLPYAAAVGLIALFAGCIPAGFGVPWLVTIPMGLVICWLVVRIIGRPLAS